MLPRAGPGSTAEFKYKRNRSAVQPAGLWPKQPKAQRFYGGRLEPWLHSLLRHNFANRSIRAHHETQANPSRDSDPPREVRHHLTQHCPLAGWALHHEARRGRGQGRHPQLWQRGKSR